MAEHFNSAQAGLTIYRNGTVDGLLTEARNAQVVASSRSFPFIGPTPRWFEDLDGELIIIQIRECDGEPFGGYARYLLSRITEKFDIAETGLERIAHAANLSSIRQVRGMLVRSIGDIQSLSITSRERPYCVAIELNSSLSSESYGSLLARTRFGALLHRSFKTSGLLVLLSVYENLSIYKQWSNAVGSSVQSDRVYIGELLLGLGPNLRN